MVKVSSSTPWGYDLIGSERERERAKRSPIVLLCQCRLVIIIIPLPVSTNRQTFAEYRSRDEELLLRTVVFLRPRRLLTSTVR